MFILERIRKDENNNSMGYESNRNAINSISFILANCTDYCECQHIVNKTFIRYISFQIIVKPAKSNIILWYKLVNNVKVLSINSAHEAALSNCEMDWPAR